MARNGDRGLRAGVLRARHADDRPRHFMLEGTKDETDAAVLGSFLQQFYEGAQYVPKLVVVPDRAGRARR